MIGLGLTLGLGARAGEPVPTILLTASSVLESAVSGSTVGVLSVANVDDATGWTFTETADPDNKFAISGSNLNTNAALDFETAQSHSVTVTASKTGEDDIVRVFTISVTNVFEAADLGALSVPASVSRGSTVNIMGATSGSTITGTIPTGWTLDGAARTIAIAADAPTGSQSWSLTETLADSSNSPRVSSGSSEVTEAVALPAFNLAEPDWSDDFETAGELNGTNGWTVLSGNGQFVKGKAASEADSSVRCANNFQAVTDATAPSTAFDSENMRLVIDMNTGVITNLTGGNDGTVWEQNRPSIYFWYQDANNWVRVRFDKNNDRVGLERRVSGSTTTVNFLLSDNDATYGDRTLLEIETINGFAYARFNGKPLANISRLAYPYHGLDLTPVSAPNRLGKVGIQGATRRWPIAYSMSATRLRISIDDHSTAIPRDGRTASGATGYEFTGKYWIVTPDRLAYRVLNYSDNSLVQDWREAGSAAFDAGAWSGLVDIPTGGPYELEFALIDTDGDWHVSRSRPVIVGARILYYGQSNSTGRTGGAAPDILIDAAGSLFSGATGTRDGEPADHFMTRFSDNKSSRAYQTARIAAEKFSIPVIVSVLGQPGSTIGGLKPGTETWDTVVADIATHGPPEGVMYDQGEGEAAGGVLTAINGYGEALVADIITPFRTATGDPDLPFILVDVGRYASGTPTGPAGTWAQFDADTQRIRREKLDVANADPLVWIGGNHIGQVHADPFHYTAEGYTEACIRNGFDAARYFFGVDAPDGRGPLPTGATINGARDQITITFDMNGAGALTDLVNKNTGTVPTPPLAGSLYGYRVSIDDFVSLRAISAINRVGNTLVIDMAAAIPAGTVKVDSFYGASFDDTNLFYGTDYADQRADIPVDAIVVPLVAS